MGTDKEQKAIDETIQECVKGGVHRESAFPYP